MATTVLEGNFMSSELEFKFIFLPQFVFINRRDKIASGQRTTSYSWLLNDKRGRIGKALSSTPPEHREHVFMAGQLSKFIMYRHELCAYDKSLSLRNPYRTARGVLLL